MNIDTQIRAWKDPKFRQTMNADELLPNPAGNRLIEMDEDEIRGLWGAQAPVPVTSGGYVCTVSGECNGGSSCWSSAPTETSQL